MDFQSLVSSVHKFGAIKTDLLIVIPCYSAYEDLKQHLAYLSRQTYQDFNVLVVLGCNFDEKMLCGWLSGQEFKYGVIVCKRKDDNGSAGGFFTGQKFALEQGYPFIILSEDDCMPVDEKVVENLHKNRSSGYVSPFINYISDGFVKKGFPAGAHHYILYADWIFTKYGLYYLPLHHGSEDVEFTQRVAEPKKMIGNFVQHPYKLGGTVLFASFDRSWFFLLHAILFTKPLRATLSNLQQFVLLTAISLFFLPTYGRKVFISMNRLVLSFTYGKPAQAQIDSGIGGFFKENVDFSGFEAVEDTDNAYSDLPGGSKITSILLEAAGKWRRQIRIEKTYSFTKIFLFAALARKVYVSAGRGKYVLASDNSSLAAHIAKLFMFALFLPIYAAAALLIHLPLTVLRRPRTLGYGVRWE